MAVPRSELLLSVLDGLPFAVTTVDPKGVILFVNAIAARNLSGTLESVTGTSLYSSSRRGASRHLAGVGHHRAIGRIEVALRYCA